MVSIATMTEGALDVLSCGTFIALAANGLPSEVNGFIVLFALLELVNGAQSFALQCILSGGHDDTPLDLVRWNGFFRLARVVIDAGSILLRIILWVSTTRSARFSWSKPCTMSFTSHLMRKDKVESVDILSPQDWQPRNGKSKHQQWGTVACVNEHIKTWLLIQRSSVQSCRVDGCHVREGQGKLIQSKLM